MAAGGLPWISWCYFGLAVASAVFPWVNAEVIVLSLPAVAPSKGRPSDASAYRHGRSNDGKVRSLLGRKEGQQGFAWSSGANSGELA